MRIPSQSRSIPAVGAPRRARGFTIVELMTALAVAAVLMMIAVPSFSNMINSNRLTTAANAMIGALNSARMEAVKRNGSVQFCSNVAATNTTGATDALGNACGTSAGVVFAVTGTTATQVLAAPSALSTPSIQVRGTLAAIRYNGTGLGYAPGSTTPFGTGANGSTVVELCSTALHSNNDIQINMVAGSIITSSTPSTVATCP